MIFNSFSLQLDCMMSSDCRPEIRLTLNTTKSQKQSLWPSGWPTANTDNAADSPPTGNSVDVVPHVPDVFLLLLWFVCRRDIKKHPLNKQLVVLDISLCSNCPPNPPSPPSRPLCLKTHAATVGRQTQEKPLSFRMSVYNCDVTMVVSFTW